MTLSFTLLIAIVVHPFHYIYACALLVDCKIVWMLLPGSNSNFAHPFWPLLKLTVTSLMVSLAQVDISWQQQADRIVFLPLAVSDTALH